jgi:hypothetical protein
MEKFLQGSDPFFYILFLGGELRHRHRNSCRGLTPKIKNLKNFDEQTYVSLTANLATLLLTSKGAWGICGTSIKHIIR